MLKYTDFKMLEDSLDKYVQQDVERIAQDNSIPWGCFEGKSILVTGATGLIGAFLIKALACRNTLFDSKITIKALVRNEIKAKQIFHDILGRDFFEIVVNDVCNPITTSRVDYVIHGACSTSSVDFVNKPVETIWTSIQGTRNILEFAKDNNVLGIAYLSSLEYYGKPTKQDVNETDLGYLNPTSIRSSYSESKRMAECMCVSYASEYKVPVKTIRLAQTFGPGVSVSDNRVFAQFARSIINNENITLHTKGETIRNYCYTADAVSGILTVLAKGTSGEAYNIANPNTTISIAEMAKFVCENFGKGQSQLEFDLGKDEAAFGYNPTMKISLVVDKISSLGWIAKTDLREMFERTIASLRLKLQSSK